MNIHRNAILQKAAADFRRGDMLAARLRCEELLGKNPRDIGAIEILARVEFDENNLDKALAYQRFLVTALPKHLHMRLILGTMYTRMGRYDEAIALLDELWRTTPHNHDTLLTFFDALLLSGDHELAQALLESNQNVLDDQQRLIAEARVASARGKPAEAVKALRELESRRPLEPSLLFVLGKAYEKLGDADQAMECYRRANEQDRPPFDRAKAVDMVQSMMRVFTRERIRSMSRATIDTSMPIMVAARPRSGTTLLTRIIGSHPQAADGGENGILARVIREINLTVGSTLEYPQIIRDIDVNDADALGQKYIDASRAICGNAPRVADKSMNVYFDLGLVQCILPQSRVIWCRRHPIDTCLACYSEDFARGHQYAHDLTDLGVTHFWYERLMEHWVEVLDLPILRLNYEDLVDDPEGQTRRVLEFCGLPWDDRCLRYYEESPSASAGKPTASFEQVRRPIYRTSVGRAKKFEKHLGPLIEALGPYATS